MNAKKVLVPIDVASCPLEIFTCINEFANKADANLTLLHVSRLNVVCPENRLYIELGQEIQTALKKLRSMFISPRLRKEISAGIGNPACEIVVHAKKLQADLIVLTRRAGRKRRRFFETDIFEKVVRTAPCAVRVLRVNSQVGLTVQIAKADEVVPDVEIGRESWRPENVYAPIEI